MGFSLARIEPSKMTDDHPLVPEVGEFGGNVQADGAYLLELRGSVTGGGRRLHAGTFQVR
jgi:hypothetical protein